MAGPEVLRIKRKRDERAPESLLVEHARKKKRDGDGEDGDDVRPVHYIRQKTANTEASQPNSSQMGVDHGNDAQVRPISTTTSANAPECGPRAALPQVQERRVFHLRRPATSGVSSRKRKAQEDDIATFVEKRVRRNTQEQVNVSERGGSESEAIVRPPAHTALKRPGKGSTMRTAFGDTEKAKAKKPGPFKHPQGSIHDWVGELEQFAEEEAAKEVIVKPKVTAVPKLPPQRSRDLHRERANRAVQVATAQPADVDMDIEDEADYVYETYVLAPNTHTGAAQVDSQEAFGEVGYLVITEEDQAAWESYMEDEESDKDWNSDEDDENAEDWYGADYPDEELASDDEFDRNAYGYRAHGSDDEEWDDAGTFSEDEYDRRMNPFETKKTPRQSSKYFVGARTDDDEE